MNRIVAIARLQALGRRDAVLWPVGILTIAICTNLVVFASISDSVQDQPVTGALASIYIATMAFGAVAVTQHLPFALGLSVTRREFTAGLALFVTAQTIAYAVLLVLLQSIEDATGGWGLRLRMFGLGFLDDYSPPVQFAMYASPLLFMAVLGAAFGTLYARWRVNGVLTGVAAAIVLPGGAAALIGYLHRWPDVAHWFARTGPVALLAGWPLLLALLLGGASYLGLRRATP
ncbi:hypothetical protein AB0M46_24600 [Dactylosporangium sp. NPDC051485]|uniref:hypothetical protein n=1 Tax=Dactylosporangium sp. NPDC051485 TaxID=3154846 RepID=UPI003449CC6F